MFGKRFFIFISALHFWIKNYTNLLNLTKFVSQHLIATHGHVHRHNLSPHIIFYSACLSYLAVAGATWQHCKLLGDLQRLHTFFSKRLSDPPNCTVSQETPWSESVSSSSRWRKPSQPGSSGTKPHAWKAAKWPVWSLWWQKFSSVSNLYIPRIGPPISLQQNRQTNPGNI